MYTKRQLLAMCYTTLQISHVVLQLFRMKDWRQHEIYFISNMTKMIYFVCSYSVTLPLYTKQLLYYMVSCLFYSHFVLSLPPRSVIFDRVRVRVLLTNFNFSDRRIKLKFETWNMKYEKTPNNLICYPIFSQFCLF